MIRKIFIVIMLLPISLMAANTTGVYNVLSAFRSLSLRQHQDEE